MNPAILKELVEGGGGLPTPATILRGLIAAYSANPNATFSNDPPTTVTTAAQGIRNWVPQGGSGTLGQATAGLRPTFNVTPNRATFDGGDYLSAVSTGSPTGLFSYHLFRTSTLGYHNLYDNAISNIMLWVDAAGSAEPDANPGAYTAPVSDGLWHRVFVFRSTTVATKMWLDGTLLTPGIPTTTKTPPATISVFNRAVAVLPFVGDCVAFGFSNVEPTAAEIIALDGALASLVA